MDKQTLPRLLRLADRMAAARRSSFVGRQAELELLRSALEAAELPFAVLHLYGPGGIGKTTLLREYARLAQEHNVPALYLDARNVNPSPGGWLLALGQALGLNKEASLVEALAGHSRGLLLVDTYETLAPLDGWLRETFLPELPGDYLVVLAGRNPPAPAWHSDLGWRGLVRTISLRNLRPEESLQFLAGQGVPAEVCQPALEFTHGHPLALSLITEVLAQDGSQATFNPADKPDIVQALLERFVEHVPSPVHRQALEICAQARVTSEALLAATLNYQTAEAHALFEWLRSLSFIEQGPQGLFPHDLVREVFDADLRWRNPELNHRIHAQIRDYIIRRMQEARGLEQQRTFFDLVYLHRNNLLMKPYFEWKTMGTAYADPASPRDFPTILELVKHYEGAASAALAGYWLQRQPAAFSVFRGNGSEIIGFVCNLELGSVRPEDLEVDPALRPAYEYMARYGPLRPGEQALYHRFWSGSDTHQVSSPAYNLTAMTATLLWLTTPKLAWCFIVAADPDYWYPNYTYINLWRTPEVDFEVEGRRYGVFTHDWRSEPPLVWIDLLAERELIENLKVEMLEVKKPAPLVVLSQPEFQEAARQALRDYHRPAALAENPLMRSRLVRGKNGNETTYQALQTQLHKAAQTLKANPKDAKLYRAIHRTYLEPAATQELAAELLNLPFSTYRYHLAAGTERIIEWLWRHELDNSAE